MFFSFLLLDQLLNLAQTVKATPPNTTFYVGTIIEVTTKVIRRKSMYIVLADFGSVLGIRQTYLEKTDHEEPTSLLGVKIAGVTQMGDQRFMAATTFHLVGTHNESGHILVARIQDNLPNGTQIFFND